MNNLQIKPEHMTVAKVPIPTLIISITLFIPSWYWYGGIGHCRYNPGTNHCQCEHNDRPIPCLAVSLISEPQTANEQQRTQEEAAASFMKPEWLIVYVTLIYAVFAGLQWWSIRRQARIAQTTAEASKQNSDAWISAERAWILVSMPQRDALNPEPPTGLPQEPVTVLPYTIANYGRTPAWITGIDTIVRIIPVDDRLPDEPDYGDPLIRHTEENLALIPRQEKIGTLTMLTQSFVDINAGRKTLYVYGRVEYRCVFQGIEGETRFCYMYNPPPNNPLSIAPPVGFFQGGPKAYNREK
jgi:hypothetical protein